NYGGMRALMRSSAARYGAGKLPSIQKWQGELDKLAAAKRDEARQLFENQQYRAAFTRINEALEIWPDVAGAKEVDAAIAAAYPMIFVGVTQPALDHDAERLDNWGARRTGRLVHRTLVEFLGAGPEGGQYQLSVG